MQNWIIGGARGTTITSPMELQGGFQGQNEMKLNEAARHSRDHPDGMRDPKLEKVQRQHINQQCSVRKISSMLFL